ncbi:MAG: EamA family transporter [Casimicrobiaceae bacterium]
MLYFRLIATIGPARALTVTFLIPPFRLLWGWVLPDETIGANMLTGCALILLGTWLALRPGSRPAQARVAARA